MVRTVEDLRVVAIADQLRQIRIGNGSKLLSIVYIDVVKTKQIEKVGLINDAEAEELADAWFGNTVFQLRQPAIRNAESLVALNIGDSSTRLFDVSNSDVASISK